MAASSETIPGSTLSPVASGRPLGASLHDVRHEDLHSASPEVLRDSTPRISAGFIWPFRNSITRTNSSGRSSEDDQHAIFPSQVVSTFVNCRRARLVRVSPRGCELSSKAVKQRSPRVPKSRFCAADGDLAEDARIH